MAKQIKKKLCGNCKNEIPAKATKCPYCGAKNKKPFYQRTWFIVLVILVILSGIGSLGGNKKTEEVDVVVSQSTDTEETKDVIETSAPATTVEATTEATTLPETESPEGQDSQTELVDGMRPEFKTAMDNYEAFIDEYIEFMNKYAESDGTDLGLLADYTSYMAKYNEAMSSFEAWDEDESMTDAELNYYIEVQTRVSQKLLSVAQ